MCSELSSLFGANGEPMVVEVSSGHTNLHVQVGWMHQVSVQEQPQEQPSQLSHTASICPDQPLCCWGRDSFEQAQDNLCLPLVLSYLLVVNGMFKPWSIVLSENKSCLLLPHTRLCSQTSSPMRVLPEEFPLSQLTPGHTNSWFSAVPLERAKDTFMKG